MIGLADDIARSMSALSARVSTVPGRSVIGIELPNAHREKVVLREILSARDFGDANMRLPLALGKDIGGEPIIANLAKMPHLLIAGTTGFGQIGRHQHDDPVAPLQALARGMPAHHDRPEDAGTVASMTASRISCRPS